MKRTLLAVILTIPLYVEFQMQGNDVEAAIVEIDGAAVAEYRPSQ